MLSRKVDFTKEPPAESPKKEPSSIEKSIENLRHLKTTVTQDHLKRAEEFLKREQDFQAKMNQYKEAQAVYKEQQTPVKQQAVPLQSPEEEKDGPTSISDISNAIANIFSTTASKLQTHNPNILSPQKPAQDVTAAGSFATSVEATSLR